MSQRETITSPKNPVVHRLRSAAAGEHPGEMVADGYRLCADALAAGLPVLLAAVSPKLKSHRGGFDLRRRLEQRALELYECSDRVLEKMSFLTTHQGVLAVVERPRHELPDLLGGGPGAVLVVVAAGVRDPGNLGAMLRTAEAAGATGFAALAGGADPFRDKAVRGSAGSVFRLPTVASVDAASVRDLARAHGLQIVVADGSAADDYLDVDLRLPSIVVLGAEGAGMPGEIAEAADRRVRIPMVAPVESLNVSVAAGVLLFEARRQRR